jgi:arabinose-5-phosphate isomerase
VTELSLVAHDDATLIRLGRDALATEAAAIVAVSDRLGADFVSACRVCLSARGRVVVIGMGKSGHVGRKIAATLASTGTPSFFVHPAEAQHGDIGMVTRDDVVILLSNSGETHEVLAVIPVLKRLGIPLVALTGNPQSSLARAADVHVDVSVPAEACPLNLAPTASTTAALATGDALAVVLLHLRGFTEADFARSHPGGSLGRRLLLHVDEVMHSGSEVPIVGPTDTVSVGLLEMSRKGLGMTAVAGPDGELLGVFTDGDLRRALDRRIDVHATLMDEVMTRQCRTIGPRVLAVEAVVLMERHRITSLVVVDDDQRIRGALNVHDLLRAGVM